MKTMPYSFGRREFAASAGLAMAMALSGSGMAGADESVKVARDAPDAYREFIEPNLTPFDAVTALPEIREAAREGEGVEMLLYERILRVAEDGTFLEATREVAEALNQQGAEDLAEDRHRFRASTTRLSVPVARTIGEGGDGKEVADEGLFVKAEGESDSEVHSDEAILTLVYPDVKVGSLIENVIVEEVHTSLTPGEFSFGQPWVWVGNCRRLRLVIELPAAMADRLRWNSVGAGPGEPEIAELDGGYRRFTWVSDAVEAHQFERGAPPIAQMGPLFHGSTFASWDDLGRWFAGLLEDPAACPPEIKALAAEWAGGATDPRAVAERLCRRVSQDVRYTALEFGIGAYQPRPAARAAATRYGDCKDKANLLRVLLAQQGIASRLVLLNTQHAGRVDLEIPVRQAFNHAILAVDLDGEAEPIYCDPTMKGASLGDIRPLDADRDVLLVDAAGKTEWRRTPPKGFGTIETEFDLAAEPGGLSGWVTVRFGGLMAVGMRERFAGQDRQQIRKFLSGSMIGPQFSAKAIDFELIDQAEGDGTFGVRAYLLGVRAGAEPADPVIFKFPAILTLPTKTEPNRRAPVYERMATATIAGQIALPAGWEATPQGQPEANFSSDGFTYKFAWQPGEGKLGLSAEAAVTKALFHPSELAQIRPAVSEFYAWMEAPVTLAPAAAKKGKGTGKAKKARKPAVEKLAAPELPEMFTKEGQGLLIESRFPFDIENPWAADFESRKSAYQQYRKRFKGDAEAQFDAAINILIADFFTAAGDDMVVRAKRIEARFAGKIPPEKLAGAKAMVATAFMVEEEFEEALRLSAEIADDESLPEQIRQAAASVAAFAALEADNSRVIGYARMALQSQRLPSQSLLLASFSAVIAATAAEGGTAAERIMDEVTFAIDRQPGIAADLTAALPEIGQGLMDEGMHDRVPAFREFLTMAAELPTWTEECAEAVVQFEKDTALAEAMRPAVERMRAWLADHPWPEIDKDPEDGKITCASDVEIYAYEETADLPLRLKQLTGFGPQSDARYVIGRVATHCLDWLRIQATAPDERQEWEKALADPPIDLDELLDVTMEAWAMMPPEEEGEPIDYLPYYFDSDTPELFKAAVIRQREGIPAAVAYLKAIAEDGAKPWSDRYFAVLHSADLCEEAEDAAGLMASWDLLQQIDCEVEGFADRIRVFHLRSALISVDRGDYAEAWRRFEKLAALSDEELPGSVSPLRKAEIGELLGDRETTEQWWGEAKGWWDEWVAFAEGESLLSYHWANPAANYAVDDLAAAIADAAKAKKKKVAKAGVADQLRMIVALARFHPPAAKTAAEALRTHGPALSEKHAAKFAEFADRISPPPAE